ncbi:MAG TPA: phosphoribosyltransferase family protein [Candidatus Lumbricidophila sp.]|nr:phosphoribosyltransferase family protein [Candidatus Lumbricidophila sp.]
MTPLTRAGSDPVVFADRRDAGRRLAAAVVAAAVDDPVVIGLPRGGVPVAAEVAARLGAPLEVIVVRKLGLPRQPEVAMGAIGEAGVRFIDQMLVTRAGVSSIELAAVERRERQNLERRVARFRGHRGPPDLTGRTALIVDDGIATGATSAAACEVARRFGANHVILAAPVGSPDTIRQIAGADEVICPVQPLRLDAVGLYYRDFTQTEDDEVTRLLDAARARNSS